jgi:hypothetical protein
MKKNRMNYDEIAIIWFVFEDSSNMLFNQGDRRSAFKAERRHYHIIVKE